MFVTSTSVSPVNFLMFSNLSLLSFNLIWWNLCVFSSPSTVFSIWTNENPQRMHTSDKTQVFRGVVDVAAVAIFNRFSFGTYRSFSVCEQKRYNFRTDFNQIGNTRQINGRSDLIGQYKVQREVISNGVSSDPRVATRKKRWRKRSGSRIWF